MMGSMVGWIVLVLRVNEDSNKNQTEWSPNMQLPPYPYIHAPPSLFGCEAGSLRLGPPGKWLKKMNKLYSTQIYYEIHESWAPTSSVHRLELPTYTWRVKNIQTWPTKGVSKGKGSISGLYIYIYIHDQSSFIWPNNKNKNNMFDRGKFPGIPTWRRSGDPYPFQYISTYSGGSSDLLTPTQAAESKTIL